PRDRRPVVVPADRRPRRPGHVSRGETAAARRPAREGPGQAGRPAGHEDRAAVDQRRLQVLCRRWLLDAHPHIRDGAARPRLHGSDLGGYPGGDGRRGREAGTRGMTTDTQAGRIVPKPWGHELIWALTERYVGKVLVIEAGKKLSLQRHVVKDESIYVLSGRLRLHLEDDGGTVRQVELAAGEYRHVPTGRIHR